MCGAIIVVACLGKFGGSAVAARLSGLGARDAASVGVLMNTRGLTELIVLNIGLDLKVLSPTLFAMMVIMALVTTFATTPVLHLLQRGGLQTLEKSGQLLELTNVPELGSGRRFEDTRAAVLRLSSVRPLIGPKNIE